MSTSNEERGLGTSHGGLNHTGSVYYIRRVGTVLWGGSTVSTKLLAGAGIVVCVQDRIKQLEPSPVYRQQATNMATGDPAFCAVT